MTPCVDVCTLPVAFNVPVAEFVTAKELTTTDAVARLGPDLLADTFDRDEALRRLVATAEQPLALSLLDKDPERRPGGRARCG